jgi:hypothetical protein
MNSGECAAAIVAGVQLLLQPRSFDMVGGDVYSKSATMRPFDVSNSIKLLCADAVVVFRCMLMVW